jgi:hypothetical protein
MATSFLEGKDAFLYIDALADQVLADLTDIVAQAGDVDVDMGRSGGQTLLTRASGGWEQSIPGAKTLTVSFEYTLLPTGDTIAEALRTAFTNNTEITVCALDRVKTEDGANGPRFNATVESFSLSQPASGAQTASVELKLSKFIAWEVVSI